MSIRYLFSVLLFTGIVLLSLPDRLGAQGCSDAGVCSIPPASPARNDHTHREEVHSFRFGTSYGRGEQGIDVWTSSLRYGRMIGSDVSVDIKGAFASHSNAQASASGLADVTISASYRISESLMLLTGFKMPLGDGNIVQDGNPLPMAFQPGLGTYDIIVGASFEVGALFISAALQQPLVQNKNAFIAGQSPVFSGLDGFTTTSGYSRAGDLMLRVSWPWEYHRSLTITPALVPIYHLSNDTYTDQTGERRTIQGSQGLTFNAALSVTFELEKGDGIEMSVGFPMITRTVRPDGLTRALVVSLDYRWDL